MTCSEDAIISVAGSLSQRGVTSYLPLNRFECVAGQPEAFMTTYPAVQLRPGPAILKLYVSGCAYDPEGGCTSQATLHPEIPIRLQPASLV